MSDDEPARKRARASSDSTGGSLEELRPTAVETTSYVIHANHDDDYYFSDGNCIILVEDTLFNVHRSMLSRDSSTFSTLFALPQGESKEGSSDSDPVILHGDTATEFRNFLWALYSLPHEHKKLSDSQFDISKLLDIVKITRKYTLESLENWACDAIQTNICQRLLNFNEVNVKTREDITTAVRFAVSSGHDRLLRVIAVNLKHQFATSTKCLSFALSLLNQLEADENVGTSSPELSNLAGEAYFAAMLRGPSFWDLPEAGISSLGRLRILAGHYRLSREWAQLQAGVEIEHQWNDCQGKPRKQCNARWREFWKQTMMKPIVTQVEVADLRKKLQVILSAVENWCSGNVMNDPCKEMVIGDLLERLVSFDKRLPEYFMKI